MKVLIVSAEVSPLAKVGGLADVAGALPKELARLGHDVRVAMPSYPMVEDDARFNVRPVVDDLKFRWGDGSWKHAFVKTTMLGKVPVYLVGGKKYFRDATESKKLYQAGWEPYAFFCRALLEMLRSTKPRWIPDVIHVNDWHTGLLPVYLKILWGDDAMLGHVATVMTVHNLAFQGEFDYDILAAAGIPSDLYTMDKLECYGKVNFLKAGMVYADMVNTVSETYACEIQTPDYGCRLDGLLRHLAFQNRLRGVANGIDYSVFDPAKDPAIKWNYKAAEPSGKAKCKASLQKQLGLPVKKSTPLIGMVTRLTDQKGLGLVKKSMARLASRDMQLVVLGAGEPSYEKYLTTQAAKYPKKLSVTVGFDAALAQRIYAGSDLFLMPSLFEPCGLGQMISSRYGSVPIVRSTGGLADTIADYDPETGRGCGFVFHGYESKQFIAAVERALATYADEKHWKKVSANAMRCDFSTKRCAKAYAALYQEAISRAGSDAIAA